MTLHRLLAIAVASAALLFPAGAQEDAIGAPGPIVFEQTRFELAWTSNPTPAYYKQEYLPQGQTLERYGEMFMVDVLTTDATPESAAADMIAGLEQRKASDAVVNFDMIANAATGEIILDFLLSDASSGTVIVEWNAYRYVPFGNGLALFAISRRGYGDDASAFISRLKDWRSATIQSLAMMDLPDIALD